MLSITPQIAQSFAALLLAHMFADFVFQTNWMVAQKRRPQVLLLHAGIVFILSTLALGGIWQVALPVAIAHLTIDAIKTWGLPNDVRSSLTAFLTDQGAHLMTLFIAAFWWPGAIEFGWWANWAAIALPPAILLSGYIAAVIAGGYVVGMQTAKFEMPNNGLPDAGRMIGQLERTMIFLLVLIDEPTGVGFLIAAKSILRFDAAKDDRKTSEYVIIGTLASFAWALAITFATTALLEIAAPTP